MTDADPGQVSAAAAELYEEFFLPALFERSSNRVLEAAGVVSSHQVLDVGCGTGGSSLLHQLSTTHPQDRIAPPRTPLEIALSFTLQPPWFRNLVPFFDRYAQSVQIWSASENHIGYPAVDDGQPDVLIQHLGGSDPVLISDAAWVAWAPPP